MGFPECQNLPSEWQDADHGTPPIRRLACEMDFKPRDVELIAELLRELTLMKLGVRDRLMARVSSLEMLRPVCEVGTDLQQGAGLNLLPLPLRVAWVQPIYQVVSGNKKVEGRVLIEPITLHPG
jgi:hypothetical protein